MLSFHEIFYFIRTSLIGAFRLPPPPPSERKMHLAVYKLLTFTNKKLKISTVWNNHHFFSILPLSLCARTTPVSVYGGELDYRLCFLGSNHSLYVMRKPQICGLYVRKKRSDGTQHTGSVPLRRAVLCSAGLYLLELA